MIDYSKFEKSLENLILQYDNLNDLDDSYSDLIREGIAESVIQRFEICYDCMWKVLKRFLREKLGIPEVPNSPKPVLRIANENKLLKSDIREWLDYAEARVSTSHDYSGEKAEKALLLMSGFIEDARSLLNHMKDYDNA